MSGTPKIKGVLDFLSNFKWATVWCWFFDWSWKMRPKQWLVPTEETIEKLFLYNSEIHKYDIFFTPNWQFAKQYQDEILISENWTWRTKATATHYNSLSLDFDDVTKIDEFEKFMIDPAIWWDMKYTFKIKTKKWFHYHYLLKEPIVKNKLVKDYEQLIETLHILFNADPAVKDVSRYFRLPWFKYRKSYPQSPCDILLVDYNSTAKITADQLRRICAQIRRNSTVEVQSKKELGRISEGLYEKCQEIPIRNVIDKLEKETNWKITRRGNHLVIDWEMCWGLVIWNQENRVHDFTTFKKGSRPVGWVYNFIKMALENDTSKIYAFLEQHFKINIDKELANSLSFISISGINVIINKKNCITEIIYESGKDVRRKTALDFYFNAIGHIVEDEEKKALVQLVKNWKPVRTFVYKPDSFTKMKIFLKKTSGWLSLNCSEKEFDAIEEFFFKESNKGENKIFYNKTFWFNARSRFILNSNQVIELSKNTISIENATHWYYDKDYISESLTKSWLKNLPTLSLDNRTAIREADRYINALHLRYNPEKAIPIFLTIINANLFNFYKLGRLPYRPHLVMMGQTQSGKTSLLSDISLILPNFLKIASSSTPLSLLLSAIVWCPVFLTEFNKEGAKRADIYKMINNAFDQDTYEKGRPDLSVRRFELNWNFVIDTEFWLSGEYGSSRTRCVEVTCSTNDYWELDAFDWINFSIARLGMVAKMVKSLEKLITGDITKCISWYVRDKAKIFKAKIIDLNKHNKEVPEIERLSCNYAVLSFVAFLLYWENTIMFNKTEKYLLKALDDQARTISTISVGSKTVWDFFAYLTEYFLTLEKMSSSEAKSRIEIKEEWDKFVLVIWANMFRTYVQKVYKEDLSRMLMPIKQSNKIVDTPYFIIVEPTNLNKDERRLLKWFSISYRKTHTSQVAKDTINDFIYYIENLW